MDDATVDSVTAVDSFGRLALKQRASVLLKERARLISYIQTLPSFDGFLASERVERWRCRISIVRHTPFCRLIRSCPYRKPFGMAL
jgi:hypothetical protein